MINSLNKNASNADQCQSYEDVKAGVVGIDSKLAGTTSNEIFSSDVGQVSANTRVTFKRVANASRSISTGKKVSLVHSSTVTTTRSWSGPGVVSLISDVDGHAVFGFDLFNQIPRSGDLFGWVNNLDAFIKEQNVGLKEEQVRTNSTGSADSDCQDDVAAVEKALNNKSDKEGDKNPATGNRTAGSELFTIGHFASFSQMGSTK